MARRLLKHWDISTLPKNFIVYVCSQKRSGKSVLTSAIFLEHIQVKIDITCVICGNPHTATAWRKHVDPNYVHSRYNQKILKNFFQQSDELLKQGKQLPSVCFILDDVLRMRKSDGRSRTSDDPYLHRMFQECAHYNASLVLISQNIAGGTSSWCRNSDVFAFSPSSLSNQNDIELICKSYMGGRNVENNYNLLDTFERHEWCIVKFHSASRRQKELLRYYKVDRQLLTYIEEPTPSSDSDESPDKEEDSFEKLPQPQHPGGSRSGLKEVPVFSENV